MASVKIPYGRGEQILEIPDERLLAVLEPSHSGSMREEESCIVEKALRSPLDSPRLCELVRNRKNILVITSDHTRPVPSRITMPLLLEEIRRGNPEAQITILIATGMHRPSTEEELREKFGNEICRREKIVIHMADRAMDMAYFGTLPSGGELWLNHLVKDADIVVAEGFVEPHFFAGFSGGRKSILPGIAAKTAKLAFILNVLIDENRRIKAAFAGNMESAHEAGCSLCRKWAGVKARVADIVVTSNGGYPLDQNLYQAVKGMTAAEATVRKNGVIIMCAGLCDGHGGEEFYRWFADRKSAWEVAEDIRQIPPEETRPDQWEAQVLARVMCRAHCIIVTGEENREMVERMHLLWAPDVNMALKAAEQLVGKEAMVTVVPDGVGVIVTK